MRKYGDDLLYSATDITNFLGCQHSTSLDLLKIQGKIDNSICSQTDDPQLILLQEYGLKHEQAYLDSLRDEGLSVFEVTQTGTLEDKVALTREAMSKGVQVIYQGALLNPPWHGFSDFLLRVDHTPSKLGAFSYEVADTKLSRSAKPHHIVQLCFYSDIVAQEQGIYPKEMHIVLGDSEKTKFTRRVRDYIHYFTLARQRFEKFISHHTETATGEPCKHCLYCRWKSYCTADWEAIDHLSLVAGISKTQISRLYSSGISTMSELAALPKNTKIQQINADTCCKLISQAKLQLSKRNNNQDILEVLPVVERKGFNRLPKPSPGDIFFDMEGDPLYEDKLEYLFGFIHLQRGETIFTPFWGHNRDEEKIAFENSVDFIMNRLAEFPDAHIYHYASYEESALKRLAMLHGTREYEVDEILRNHKLVDLYKVVRESIRTSEPAYSIKNMECFYAKKRTGEVKNAGDSIIWYEQWRKLGDDSLLKQISDYNEFDCISTLLCRDWLLSLRPTAGVNWFSGTDDEHAKNEEKKEARQEAEARTSALKERLTQASEKDQSWRRLLGNLLEFHRREAKSQWWKMFSRQELLEDELIDDPECIGGLILDPNRPVYQEKRSSVHSFKFPPQDFKMRVGSKPLLATTLKPIGEIVALDEEELTISLKIGPKAAPLPDIFSIIPEGPINDKVLREAIFRYADIVIAGDEHQYPAITGILKNTLPKLTGVVPGSPIVSESTDLVGSTIEALCNLDSSHLVIQGPPGTGKTHTSSHAIVELLKRNKRIGITSNSHKVINHILASVEQTAQKQGFSFRGVKKSASEDQQLKGAGFIDDVGSNEAAVSPEYNLVAGTSWLFAREEMDKTLDYLFIDEAGQVSLANVVAMGLSASNIVLVGDQMQLSQPSQGVHPGGSGQSALEHLLGQHATVPPEQGILLNVTWRMHPDICRFISDAVYDSRLTAEAANSRQQLLSDFNSGIRKPSGIRFVPVMHTGCSQKCEPEADLISKVYTDLIGKHWMKRDGSKQEIGIKDILVVSPYNMQVNLLKSKLPDGALVGTVDKFQGQEAPVVLISMATSSSEEMPRDIDFLFSENRLNVAISRARCLSVLFASPKLFETPCNTIDQMRLVNLFCWAYHYSLQ